MLPRARPAKPEGSRDTVRMLIKVVLIVVAVQVLLPLLILIGRDRMIFVPPNAPPPEAGLRALRGLADVELVSVQRSDGRELAAYDARPKDPTPLSETPHDVPTVVFFHGNGGTITWMADLAEDLVAETGMRWFFAEYSGYGGNAGVPSEAEVRRDALAVWDHLTTAGTPPEKIFLYGESLGGAVAIYLASERQVGGLVLQSTFSSISSMAGRLFPWLPLASVASRGIFPNDQLIADLECPILMIHGTADSIVPYAEGERLRQAAPAHAEFMTLEGVDHNDVFLRGGPEYMRGIGEKIRGFSDPQVGDPQVGDP